MSAAVIGWPGTTYYEDFKELGMAIGGKVWFQPMQGIWVDCTACGRRDAMRGGDLSAMPNATAHTVFTEHGWTIKPTRCPACVTPSMPSAPTPPPTGEQ